MSRIDQRYLWYWNNPLGKSRYWPLWEWGSTGEVHSVDRDPAAIGTVGVGLGWGVRDYGSGIEGTQTNDGDITWPGAFYSFLDAEKWSVWAAFTCDDTNSADDNCVWGKYGVAATNQFKFRLDRGPSPQAMEVYHGNARRINVGPLAEGVPYLTVVTNDGTQTMALYVIDLVDQEIIVNGTTGTSSDVGTLTASVRLGAATATSDVFNGVIYTGGLLDQVQMTREQVILLARDIYGPIRPLRRRVRKAPAVAITDGEIVAAATSFDNRPKKPDTIFVPF